MGIIPTDIRQPMNMREVLLRIVDGSRLDEFKPLYGIGLITCWAHIHGILLIRRTLTQATKLVLLQTKHQ